MIASFGDLRFDNIEGYRISCRLKPEKGFEGRFYVYIHERRQAGASFGAPVIVSEERDGAIKPVRGTLSISDDERAYEFQNIDLRRAELGATRRERSRYLEFQYDPNITNQADAEAATIQGKRTNPLGASGLGQDYMGGIGESRQLLGFRASVSAASGTVVRFANLGALENSFLAKVVDVNKEMQTKKRALSEFTVSFSQQDFAVNRNNLEAMYVEESWGSLLRKGSPSLSALIAGTDPEVDRLSLLEHTGNELLQHDSSKEFKSEDVLSGTVEFATLVFKQGSFHKLSVK